MYQDINLSSQKKKKKDINWFLEQTKIEFQISYSATNFLSIKLIEIHHNWIFELSF